jgi:hypothetical protein
MVLSLCDPLPAWDWVWDWVTQGARKGHPRVTQGPPKRHAWVTLGSNRISGFVCNKI